MNKNILKVLLFCLLLAQGACNSFQRDLVLSRFEINGKAKNRFIVHRVPEYGDGRVDGCVVEGQIYLALASGNNNQIIGEVKDSKTLELLSGAFIKAIFKGQTIPVHFKTDSAGKFILPQTDLQKLEVNYIGYRTMVVNIGKKKSLI